MFNKKEEIENLIGTSLEVEKYRFSKWELYQWKTYIKSKVKNTPTWIGLSTIIEEYLGIEPNEAKFITTINKYYVFNKVKNYWDFVEKEKHEKLLTQVAENQTEKIVREIVQEIQKGNRDKFRRFWNK